MRVRVKGGKSRPSREGPSSLVNPALFPHRRAILEYPEVKARELKDLIVYLSERLNNFKILFLFFLFSKAKTATRDLEMKHVCQ